MNQDQIQALLDQLASYALDAVGALVILLVGWWIAGRTQYLVRRALDRVPRIDDTLKPFLSSSVRYFVIVITFVAVLAEFGVQTTSIIAVLGAAGLAIGLALQGTLQNIAAGIMLLVLRPFRVGEYIDAGGVSGTVDAINLFTTDMTTYDGVYRSVPNAELWNRNILNYSRNPTRRLDIPVGIAYEDDVERALDLLLSHLSQDTRVLPDPEPQVLVTGLGDSSVDLTLRCWTSRTDFWPLRFELNKKVKLWLDAAGISIPFPQRDVHLYRTSASDLKDSD
ncbi:MAG: mechanosensitive ion channel [Arenicellales bacterium]|jgi:small conductance mechanosensitive channel|nr:mechanosensitive ion channel [Arenicellales bacterium]MDP6411864.1 mechanosensitive ion channel [Arenicellales bacterium]MDP7450734.1 mechanosensitive ion channel [Arenicellales bacterium]MDP7615976.1 mechanosensitive ion channel [Arenicellales bacterium]|tara:strand:- start:3168 stop:4007 length:840 start_codon:yes stop_codon:yes gene_type:complete